jgi:CheY-like chemotaxis protein
MNKTILIIEDEKELLYPLKEFLELEGHSVLTAENGSLAMELLEKVEMPGLILLDMRMPVMSGWEFAAVFLAKYGKKAKIIVTTAAANAEQRAEDINADDWVEKPFNLDLLIEKINKYI